KSLLHRFARNGPQEAAPAVAQVEEYTPLARFQGVRLDLAGEAVDQLHLSIVIGMGVHVAGTQLIEQLLAAGAAAVGEDVVVHHHGRVRNASSLHRAADRDPSGTAEMRRLDPYDHVTI